MRTVVIGAGPTGLFTGIALARRGHRVVIVDRDPGPTRRGVWRRKGVMQFHHAHSFRGQVVDALAAEMPDVLAGLVRAGAEVARLPNQTRPASLLCRRPLFERELRRCASGEPGVTIAVGHVDEVVRDRGSAAGVKVAGATVDAELVIDASGRASRVVQTIRGRGEGGDCGATYAGRLYRLRNGAEPASTNSVIGLSLSFPDYGAVVFVHDAGYFTVTLVHAGADERLRGLRHNAVFEAVVRTIPKVGEWIEPDRSVTVTQVLPGGRLYNRYRGQLDESGRPVLAGLISVGDAVCTTTPLAGRGVALSFLQARELVGLLDADPGDIAGVTMEFDRWCVNRIKPWFVDHEHVDGERMRRWSGHDVNTARPLPSDLIVAAAEADPRLADIVGPYVTMDALPSSLAPAEPHARALFAQGWRPTAPVGPTADELAALCVEYGYHAA